MRKLLCTVLCIAASVVATPSHAETTALDRLKGAWVIDYDGTLEYAQQSPKYTPAEAARLPGQLKLLRGLMKMQVTDTQVVTYRGDRKQAVTYTPDEVRAERVILKASARGQEVTLTFTFLPGGGMNMRSSGTDDTDFLIWKKSR